MSIEQIRMCHDVVPDLAQREESAFYARKLNEANAPDPKFLSRFASLSEIQHPEALVMLTGSRWQTGQKVKVGFFEEERATREMRARIRQYANEWSLEANIDLDWMGFQPEVCDVRITFTRGGSWSYLGTDCLGIPRDRPTMQFGWLDESSSEDEIRRVVLHEFGHMFDFGHEQAHPRGNIPWDKEAAYAYYQQTQGWSRAQVDAQVFRKYSETQTNFSTYDKTSIMHYPIDNRLTIGDFSVGLNSYRSLRDKKYAGLWYPYPSGASALVAARKIIEAELEIQGVI